MLCQLEPRSIDTVKGNIFLENSFQDRKVRRDVGWSVSCEWGDFSQVEINHAVAKKKRSRSVMANHVFSMAHLKITRHSHVNRATWTCVQRRRVTSPGLHVAYTSLHQSTSLYLTHEQACQRRSTRLFFPLYAP